MRCSDAWFFGIDGILCLTLVGCTSAVELAMDKEDKQFERHTRESQQPEEDFPVKIMATHREDWECVVPNTQVGEYPESIVSADQWTQLWTRWQPEKAIPDVDFKTSMVCVISRDAGDGNSWGVMFYREADGTITRQCLSTAMGYSPTDQTAIRFYLVPKHGLAR